MVLALSRAAIPNEDPRVLPGAHHRLALNPDVPHAVVVRESVHHLCAERTEALFLVVLEGFLSAVVMLQSVLGGV